MQKIRPVDRPAPVYKKSAGTSPLPGYVLLEPLGHGGFGEVWKCEVSGGLHKAIKFVSGGPGRDAALLRQEYEAIQQVKAIRHPYLLCLERVELIDDELILIMGLADQNLADRFHECTAAGLPGIPRAELLGYLREAAEALDVIGERHGLQHLDVKPDNLFLTAGHVQVGDYGLLIKLDRGADAENRGRTPKYAAPEVLRGGAHPRSDQYSLALVYHELLTGKFPFPGPTITQIMLQHGSAPPDVSALPEADRAAVATALAKRPEARFASCRELIDALSGAAPPRSHAGAPPPAPPPTPPATPPPRDPPAADPGSRDGVTGPGLRLPRLVATKRPPQPGADTPRPAPAPPAPAAPAPAPAPAVPAAAPAHPVSSAPTLGVHLPFFLSVVPIEWLQGQTAPEPELAPADMARAVVAQAEAYANTPDPGEAEGTVCRRFLTTIDQRIARVKLELLRETNGELTVTEEGNQIVLRYMTAVAPAPSGLFRGFGKKPAPAGYEVAVRFPEPGTPVGEAVATGRVLGAPPPEFARLAADAARELLDGVQRTLGNFSDRRQHPRVPARFPITAFPLHPDGRVERPVAGRCLDVSAGGLTARAEDAIGTPYAYVAFDGVPKAHGLAVLLQIVRRPPPETACAFAGRYRLDLWFDQAE
jgi:serine/threonine protein kinase